MDRYTISLLGVPFKPMTLDETVRVIQDTIEAVPKSPKPAYVATVNTDFLLNTHSCSRNQVLHPELLESLRQSKINSLDGVPLLWIIKLLGGKVPERVTGIDLTKKLIKLMGEKKQSVFLLGGNENSTQKAAEIMLKEAPGLKIAGTACPVIYTNGPRLVDANTRDDLLIEQINATQPDLLLISLGNPKQEIWFERVKSQLKVPVAMGIGGTLMIISGAHPRAPETMQKFGLEWLYRLWNEPGRLWKRYLIGIPKAIFLFFPLIVYHSICRFLNFSFYRHRKTSSVLQQGSLFLSKRHSFTVIPFPVSLDENALPELEKGVEEAFSQDMIIFDFDKVRFIDLAGIEFLLQTWERAGEKEKRLFGINLNEDVRWLLYFHRVWPQLSQSFLPSARELMTLLRRDDNSTAFYESLRQVQNCVIWSFFGQLGNQTDYETHLHQFTPIINGKNCILDLSYTTRVDNSGLEFLLKIAKFMKSQNRTLLICGCNSSISKTLKAAGIEEEFVFIDYLADALKKLKIQVS